MVNNFYTLEALTREWAPDLKGCIVGDAFSQVKDEFSLALTSPSSEWMLRCSVQAPFLFIFRTEGYNKARRNVATLFKSAFDRRVASVHMAERDRMLFIEFEDGWHFRITLFGTRANVFLVDDEGVVQEAFRSSDKHRGEPAPEPRAAPMPDTFEEFEGRWRENRNTTEQAVAGAMTLFTRTIANEVVYRSGVEADSPDKCTEDDRRRLFETSQEILTQLKEPDPHVYWNERGFAEEFSLIPLAHRPEKGEAFDTVDEAVRLFVRRRLAEEHFRRLYDPLEKALSDAAEHYRRSADKMLEELTSPSRAERYERWGHLLMAAPQEVPEGADEVTLPDLFEGDGEVTIPLDPALSPVENAEEFYDKARRTRASRKSAEERLMETEEKAETAARLLEELREVEDVRGMKRFRKEKAEELAPFVQTGEKEVETVPFRRFPLDGPYEVWVGKNARQNDELTFHHAQKYDLWFHARNMPGSHTVLRLPNRDAEPPKRVIHQAAAIAAYYSKGRGSKMVPVMYTERKYVRSPKGGPPGAVHVEYEDVVLIEPRLPGS